MENVYDRTGYGSACYLPDIRVGSAPWHALPTTAVGRRSQNSRKGPPWGLSVLLW